jgi:hypothetical protein
MPVHWKAFLLAGHHAGVEAADGDEDRIAEVFFATNERMRQVWNAYEAELLAEWVEDAPGSRPASWWYYSDNVTECRRVDGRYQAFLEGGLQRCHETGIAYLGLDDPSTRMIEATAAYLDRLGLWLDGERERVPAAAFTERPFSIALTWQPDYIFDTDDEAAG